MSSEDGSRHVPLSVAEAIAMTPEDAAVEMGKQCSCNIFNTERAAEYIRNECS